MSKPIYLSRRELYDLIWSKPMRDVAVELAISDVGLSKVCDRYRVPKPERGYWNKKQAGHKVKQAIFVEIDSPEFNRIEIKGVLSQIPDSAKEILEKARAERRANISKPRHRILAPPMIDPIIDVHGAIRRTAQTLRKCQPGKIDTARAFGEGLCGIDVASKHVERAVAFLDGLVRKLEAKSLLVKPTGRAMEVSMGQDLATFTLKERTCQQKHIPTPEELAAEAKRQQKLQRAWGSQSSWSDSPYGRTYPEFDTVYTGEFILQIEGYSDGVRRRWADGKTQTVESLLDNIIVGFEVLLAARKADREEREERERQRQTMARRRELARRRSERNDNRLTYFRSILDLNEEIDHLRVWLTRNETGIVEDTRADFGRMIAWVKERLSILEETIEPDHIDQDLKSKKLFPEVDDLQDSLGDPPDDPLFW